MKAIKKKKELSGDRDDEQKRKYLGDERVGPFGSHIPA